MNSLGSAMSIIGGNLPSKFWRALTMPIGGLTVRIFWFNELRRVFGMGKIFGRE
jgi:hypothetical protein